MYDIIIMESKINTVAEDVDSKDKYAADLDQALAVAGKLKIVLRK